MSVPDPPWKQKTRPCPFFSQGRCLFADSCNFLHSARVKRHEGFVLPSSSPMRSASTSPVAKTVRFRSPPRSPRTSSLLMALGDVIQQDEEVEVEVFDDEDEDDGDGPSDVHVGGSGSESFTLIDSNFGREIGSFRDSMSPSESSVVDNEEEVTITRFSRSMVSAPIVSTSFGSPDASTDGLLSPISMAGTAPVSLPLGHCEREDSIDSGYADTWTGPSPFVASPPRASRPVSTLSLLSSPFTSPASRVFSVQPGNATFPTPLSLALFSPTSVANPDTHASYHSDVDDSPSPQTVAGLPDEEQHGSPGNLDLLYGEPSPPHNNNQSSPVQAMLWPSAPMDDSHDSPEDGLEEFVSFESYIVPSPPQDSLLLQSDIFEELTDRHGQPTPPIVFVRPASNASVAIALPADYSEDGPEAFDHSDDTVSSLYNGYYSPHSEEDHETDPPLNEHTKSETLFNAPTLPPMAPEQFSPLIVQKRVSSLVQELVSSPMHEEPTLSLTPPDCTPLTMRAEPGPPLQRRAQRQSPVEERSSPPLPQSLQVEQSFTDEEQRQTSLFNVQAHVTQPSSSQPHAPIASSTLTALAPPSPNVPGSPIPPSLDAHVSPTASSPHAIAAPISPFIDAHSPPSHAVASPTPSPPQVPALVAQAITSVVPALSNLPVIQTAPPLSSRPGLSSLDSIASPSNSDRTLLDNRLAPTTLSNGRISTPPAEKVTSSVHPLPLSIAAAVRSDSPEIFVSPLQGQPPRVFSLPNTEATRPQEDIQPQRADSLPQILNRDLAQEKSTSTTKVPFGFRHSVTDRSLLAKRASTSIAWSRPRPPALVGLSPKSQDQALAKDPRLPDEPASSSSNGSLKPLRLSMVLSSSPLGSTLASSGFPPPLTSGNSGISAFTPASPTVSSEYSLSHNQLLSSHRTSLIPSRTLNTLVNSHTDSPSAVSLDSPSSGPHSAPVSVRSSWQARNRLSRTSSFRQSRSDRYMRPDSKIPDRYVRPDSRLSEPGILYEDDEEDNDTNALQTLGAPEETIRRPLSSLSRVPSTMPSPAGRSVVTPRPTLMFALASDDVEEVRRVLESGEANPNDDIGPVSALAFTLGARQLSHRVEMVRLLLAYGADTSALGDAGQAVPSGSDESAVASPTAEAKLMAELDPATRYYVARAQAPQTRRASSLINRSFFRPLARVRYDLVGQDRALEQLFRVLSMPTMAPIVVLLCGPSGHGKSLLARKFGSLLDVPTHTVNMTTLRSTHDIWRSYSMSPYEAPSTCTLADFLIANEGKRCVVVLDEIEKTQDERILASLLMPWELGRCSFEAGHRHVNVSQVIWLGTSNVGHDLVFEHQNNRRHPDANMPREEYVDLMGLLRPRVSDKLGASLLSRVTTVLPFVPFTTDEKMAIAAEALFSLAGEDGKTLPPATVEMVVRNSLSAYLPAEGARSLYRAVSTQLLDTI